MRIRNLIVASIAALMTIVACEPETDLGLPSIKIDGDGTMAFEAAGGDQQVKITATRDWMAECDAEWLILSPENGKASLDAQTVVVTAKENKGMDRTADIKFTIGMSSKTLTVTQKGPGGSTEALIVYANNFDKTKAEKGSSWSTYLDTFKGWHNEEGTGKSTVTYGFQKITARTNSANGSAGQHSLYTELGASGINYLWLGTAPTYFAVKNITLPDGKTDYTLSFGTERYEYSETGTIDNTFNWDEFKAYVSIDAKKWVKLSCDFAGGSLPVGKWDLASSTFTVPAGTQKLHVYFTSTKGSAYAIDDVKLVQASVAGIALDFAAGEAFEVPDSNTSGGDDSGNTGDVPEGTGEGTLASPYSAAKAWNIANALGENDNQPGVYVQGTVVEIKEVSTDFGNATYYISDEDGVARFYVYRGKYLNNESFTSQDQIKVGDNVVIYGDLMNYKGNSPQLGQGNYIVKLNGSEGSAPEQPESNGDKTVAEFIETADDANFYTLTGTVSNFNAQYFSFDLTDDSGSIYVYSVNSASKSQWKGIVGNGSVVTIIGKYLWYEHATDASKNKHEVVDAWIVEATQGDAEVTPPAGEAGEYDPQGITWTLGENAYDNTSKTAQTAVVNGVKVANLLKLGTGEKVGNATLHVPAGTEKLGFYAVAWNGKTAQVKFSINGVELETIEPSSNTGAAQNPPYTITVTDNDYYVIEMPSSDAVDVKVETLDPANGRALFIKLEANPETGQTPGEDGGEEPEPPVTEGTKMTVAEVLASTTAIPAGSYIEAVVISDRNLNNLTSKKGMYVQDETAGLQFYLAANHEFNFGDKVKVDLSNVTLADYNGAVQVSGLGLDKIETLSTGNPVEAKTVTIADFLANKYEGQYIAIEGVQVVASDLEKTFVMPGNDGNDAHTSINVETADGKTFAIFSSKYATYGNEKVPQGSGTIKGISSVSKGAMQIVFAKVSDFAGLIGERFADTPGGDTPGDDVTPPAGGDDPAPSEGSWAKVTSLTDLTAGKYVVVFKHDDDGKYYAMTNASASKNPSGIEVTVEGAAISGNVDASVQWTFTGDNEAGFSISAGNNYLNSKDDSQGISISTTSTCKWYVTEDASNGYLLQRKDTEIARYLAAYRNSSGVVTFRYYNVGASYKGELMFFKQAE